MTQCLSTVREATSQPWAEDDLSIAELLVFRVRASSRAAAIPYADQHGWWNVAYGRVDAWRSRSAAQQALDSQECRLKSKSCKGTRFTNDDCLESVVNSA